MTSSELEVTNLWNPLNCDNLKCAKSKSTMLSRVDRPLQRMGGHTSSFADLAKNDQLNRLVSKVADADVDAEMLYLNPRRC